MLSLPASATDRFLSRPHSAGGEGLGRRSDHASPSLPPGRPCLTLHVLPPQTARCAPVIGPATPCGPARFLWPPGNPSSASSFRMRRPSPPTAPRRCR
ncbi:hypothetical protein E2C01_075340 [Portunus trituberculatus]|uniref:Uncharacterized protein n=1 Tax=Portunus trituberculatus TaxID=210409 RepID=A0A5B7IAG5_PORTR|nr:hypothetical protein [Portunus trituberculatus]